VLQQVLELSTIFSRLRSLRLHEACKPSCSTARVISCAGFCYESLTVILVRPPHPARELLHRRPHQRAPRLRSTPLVLTPTSSRNVRVLTPTLSRHACCGLRTDMVVDAPYMEAYKQASNLQANDPQRHASVHERVCRNSSPTSLARLCVPRRAPAQYPQRHRRAARRLLPLLGLECPAYRSLDWFTYSDGCPTTRPRCPTAG
jgi:hypothetical protein